MSFDSGYGASAARADRVTAAPLRRAGRVRGHGSPAGADGVATILTGALGGKQHRGLTAAGEARAHDAGHQNRTYFLHDPFF